MSKRLGIEKELPIPRQDVYDLYWHWASERQRIFWSKLRGEPAPWTDDPILQEYKFCNAYRASDRVSQYLIRNVIYDGREGERDAADAFFRIILFKLFNKEGTWEILGEGLGREVSLDTFGEREYAKVLTEATDAGERIYTDAYMSCANKAFGYDRKHENHLALISKMFVQDGLADKLLATKDMKEAFELIRAYPLIGDFMAYQLVTDLCYSPHLDHSEDQFTVAGPGSERGIKKAFEDMGDYSKEDIIRMMYERQDEEFERLGLDFERLGTRPLQLIDCQNIFCELDKYCRVAHPELASNRTKIKKRYAPKSDRIDYMYPPKWNIGDIG